tara:strand:+ start:60 stop:593 length:534 start_codon:yes stop_codon:yes gene_type:complete
MNLKTLLVLLSIILLSSGLRAHDFYLSVTTLKHNVKNEKLAIQIKLFVNDLEESIFQEQGVNLGLWENSPIENAERYVEKYIYSKLFISINNNPVEIEFIEQKMKTTEVTEDNVIFCELEVCNVSEIFSIGVQNKLLTESFDSQANIVVISANGIRNTINLDKKIYQDKIIYELETM